MIKQYMIDVTSRLDVGTNKTRVGLIQFGEDPHTEFQLSTFSVTFFRLFVNFSYFTQNIKAIK